MRKPRHSLRHLGALGIVSLVYLPLGGQAGPLPNNLSADLRELLEAPAALRLAPVTDAESLRVRDDAGRVVGWVTLADLARRLLVESEPLQAELRSLTEAGDQLR